MSDKQKAWTRIARRVVRMVNAGWWIERFTPLLVVFSIAVSVAILILRSRRFEATPLEYLSFITCSIAILGAAAWARARTSFVRLPDGFVRIEKEMRLHNALSTALAGAGPWPDPPKPGLVNSGYTWRWSRVFVPALFAACVIAAAILIPVSRVAAGDQASPSEPLAWQEMESWIEKLEAEDAVEKTDLEQIRERIDQLRDRPQDEWFSHHTMEATDTLKQQLSQSIRELGKDAAAAGRSLGALEKYASRLTESARNQLISEYNEALKGMQSGKLSPNAGLMDALKDVDWSKLSQLTQFQSQQLMDALERCAGACSQCLGGTQPPAGWAMDSDRWSENQLGAPNQRFPEGGRIQRGPGEAPISLAADPSDLGTANPEGVRSQDYSRAAFGDTLAIGEGDHPIDKSKTGPQTAGAVRSQGEGGERIWRESLLPDEREVLKRYFK